VIIIKKQLLQKLSEEKEINDWVVKLIVNRRVNRINEL